jgi:hypothetical protein
VSIQYTGPARLKVSLQGRQVERVALPARTRLAGFGSGVVYLARTDDDDLQWLGRYRLPGPPPSR